MEGSKYMMKKATILLMLFVLGMFCSCSVEDNYVDTPTAPGDELREKLQTLDWGSDTCYVYGHKTPDMDAVTSALAYARLMRSLGYNCKAKVSSDNHMTVNGERRDAQHFSFGMIFNERAAVVYNFSPRYFAGATLTMSNSFFDNDVTVNQNKWRARAIVGMRL